MSWPIPRLSFKAQCKGKKPGLGFGRTECPGSPSSCTCDCVTLGMSSFLSEPRFPSLQNQDLMISKVLFSPDDSVCPVLATVSIQWRISKSTASGLSCPDICFFKCFQGDCVRSPKRFVLMRFKWDRKKIGETSYLAF